MIADSNRLNRIHVVNVRLVKDFYYVVLSDNSQFEWKEWNTMSEKDRNYYKGI